MYNCHLAWWSGAIQRMLFSNIHWKVLYPVEQEEAWNFKTSFKRRQWHLVLINQGMIEKARQDLEIKHQIIRQISIQSRSIHYIPRGKRDVIRLRIQPKIKRPLDDVNECWPLQKNTWPQWADTWAHHTVRWYWSADALFWQLSIDHNIDVQYEFSYAPKRKEKCEIEHWFPCGADGQVVYGHVITKFSGMGRFTYPWCSAGALWVRSSPRNPFLCWLFVKKNYV